MIYRREFVARDLEYTETTQDFHGSLQDKQYNEIALLFFNPHW